MFRSLFLFSTAALLISSSARADLTTGNLVVTINEFTGSINAPSYVAEYTTSGSRVQTFANLPEPGGTADTTDQVRDLVVGADGLYVYNGTFDPTIATLDPTDLTPTWTQPLSFAEWSTVNNISYGGLQLYNNQLFATDMDTVGGSAKGVVRFDLAGGSTIRFGTANTNPRDLNLDPAGNLYALTDRSVELEVFDSQTGAFDREINLAVGSDYRAIDVAADGSIFAANWSGDINRFTNSGVLLDSINVAAANFSDLDINDLTGEIALGTGFDGDVVLTDLTLDSFTRFSVTDSPLGGDTFVSFVNASAVPEPSSLGLLLVAFAAAGFQWHRRRLRPQVTGTASSEH